MNIEDETRQTSMARPSTCVIKFGGTSVTGGHRIGTISDVVQTRLETTWPVVVISAFAKVTTLLEAAAFAARHGAHDEVFGQLEQIHEAELASMNRTADSLESAVGDLLAECRSRLDDVAAAGVCPPDVLDDVLSYGERLSTTIVTADLVDHGIPAHAVDAAEVVVTDASFGDARADLQATRERVREAFSTPRGVPVVTGFLGATADGRRTTLGREGSDYSAAILGWALEAEAVEIWTDVEGVMTADPRIVSDAVPHRFLSYDELFELARGGAKVVHPKTVRPLRDLGIPLTIRSTAMPSAPGTRVGPEGFATERSDIPLGVARKISNPGDGAARAVVTAIGSSRVPLDERRRRALAEALAAAGIEVTSVVDEGSDRSVGFLVAPEDGTAAVRALHQALFDKEPAPPTSEGVAVPRGDTDGVHA